MTDGTPMLDYAYRRLSPSQMSRDRTRMSKYRDRLRNGSYLSDNAHLMNNRIDTTNDIVNNNTGNQQDIQCDIKQYHESPSTIGSTSTDQSNGQSHMAALAASQVNSTGVELGQPQVGNEDKSGSCENTSVNSNNDLKDVDSSGDEDESRKLDDDNLNDTQNSDVSDKPAVENCGICCQPIHGDLWYRCTQCAHTNMNICQSCRWVKNELAESTHQRHINQIHEYVNPGCSQIVNDSIACNSCGFEYDYKNPHFKIWGCTDLNCEGFTMCKKCKTEGMHLHHDMKLEWIYYNGR